jgi:hypothetical protein
MTLHEPGPREYGLQSETKETDRSTCMQVSVKVLAVALIGGDYVI